MAKPVDYATVVSEEQIKGALVGIGVNTAIRSYDVGAKNAAIRFLQFPLKNIAPCWDFLDDTTRALVLDHHHEEFKAWIKSLE